ncbi:MAG: hypothetical protein P8X50_07990 [Maritimibacter sp.]|jgi:DNA gyrase inhibitor GyrI
MQEFSVLSADERPYLYVKVATDYDNLGREVAKGFADLTKFMDDNRIHPRGLPLTVLPDRPTELFRIQVGCIVAKDDLAQARGDIHAGALPAGRSVHCSFRGHYSDFPGLYAAMVEYGHRQGHMMARTTWQYLYKLPEGRPLEQIDYECHYALREVG